MTHYSLDNIIFSDMNQSIHDNQNDNQNEKGNKRDIDLEMIFLEISKNWNNLEKNEIIKELVDMKTNNLCKQIKNDNPHFRNSYIQSLVFSFIYAMNLKCNSLPYDMSHYDDIDDIDDIHGTDINRDDKMEDKN